MRTKVNISFLLCLLFSAYVASAQTVSVSGRLFDSEHGEGVAGAVVECVRRGATEQNSVKYTTSDFGGNFKFNSLVPGHYLGKATFIGYKDSTFEFDVAGLPVTLAAIEMSVEAIGIETVVKQGVSSRATMMGDTLCYHADAFKVAMDAEVEALLKKMPGITISGGRIEAHGEEVKKIYVDGSEFFGSDIRQVLQSIPAQAVESIEVYNRLSEAAQVTGVDDGEGGKVINIITRRSMNHSTFGKVHAGLGYEPNANPLIAPKLKYTAGGSVNIFNGDARLTIMGLFNNLNRQNLTDDDMEMAEKGNTATSRKFSVNSQDGVASAEIFALNYTDKWGRRKRAKFEGSLFYNHIDAKNSFTVDRWYNRPAKLDTIHYDQFSNPDNHMLRFRGRLDWKVAKRQKLVVIPSLNYSKNYGFNRTDSTSLRHGESGFRWMPSGNNGFSENLNFSTYAQYHYKFLKQGRVFMMIASVSHSNGDIDRDYYTNSGKASKISPDKATIKYTYSSKFTDSRITTLRFQPSLRERLGRYSNLNLTYRYQTQFRERTLRAYDTDENHHFDASDLNPLTSSDFEGMFSYHQAALGYRYSKQRNWASLSMAYQYTTLMNHNRWLNDRNTRSFHHPIYNATVQWAFDAANSLRVSVNSEVKSPSLWTMLNVYDLSNSQYISRGNPNLKPYCEHNAFVRYTNITTSLGTTFMIMGKVQHIQDYVGTSVEYSPETITVEGKNYNPLQVTMPVNLQGYWLYEGRISLGFPIKWLGSNLNISLGADYTQEPVEIVRTMGWNRLSRRDIVNRLTGYAQFTLGSNISEKIDFTVDWRCQYKQDESSLVRIRNDYFTHSASANLKVVLPLGFTIVSDVVFTQMIGLTNRFGDNFTVWNVALGKKVLRNLGEVQLCVHDIFNDDTSFARYVYTGYSQMRYNTTMGRYFLVRFTYNIRSFPTGSRRLRQMPTSSPSYMFDRMEKRFEGLKL